ncbi:hypothetical protein AB0C59_10335 [Streptomyces sp. NPDC048664]|uniref:hypothetical protein n=1 Tax=Streptomyces sp. NPDC048664 TaxID=3154505 RepID=UPI003443DB24
MMFKRASAVIGLILATTLTEVTGAGAATAAQGTAAPASSGPVNFLYASIGDFDSDVKPLLDRADIAGVQLVVPWKALERQEEQYDFSAIDSALEYTRARGKKLFVQVQDRFFTLPARLPEYLLKDPRYSGGAAPTTNESGLGPGEPGAVAAQWNPAVRNRFHHLLKALAERFDGRLAGVNLPETATAVDVDKDRTGYSDDAYFRAELDNMAYGARVFTKTPFVQYVNFWPGEWNNDHDYMGRAFAFAEKHGVGLGGPDILPNRPAQMQNSYPFFHRYRGRLPLVAMAVQEPDFEYTDPDTGKPYTRKEFTDFGKGFLGADCIFWATSSPWLKRSAK